MQWNLLKVYILKLQFPAVTGNELLYFADICAGPGGFSEYVLWRKKWGSKGFGFTLKGQNDFKLEDFFAGPPETFEPHYGMFLVVINFAFLRFLEWLKYEWNCDYHFYIAAKKLFAILKFFIKFHIEM